MYGHDPYDYRIAFDDVLGAPASVRGIGGPDVVRGIGGPDVVRGMPPAEIIDMAGGALGVMKKRRFGSSITQVIERTPHDATEYTFVPPGYSVLGAETGDVPVGKYPLYDQLRARFRAAIGPAKLVRIDGDDASYADFRTARRQSYLDDLEARVSKLEQGVAEHTADHHGGGRVARLEDELRQHLAWSGDNSTQVLGDALRGGRLVSLALSPQQRRAIECWLDVDEVLVSVRLSPHCTITTGQPVQPVIEELVGCAEVVGCCGLDALVIGCEFAPSVVGHQLLSDLSRFVSTFGTRKGKTILGAGTYVMRPQADPETAAAMALLQRAQQRDRQALREGTAMAFDGHFELLKDAADRLVSAQTQKARGV